MNDPTGSTKVAVLKDEDWQSFPDEDAQDEKRNGWDG